MKVFMSSYPPLTPERVLVCLLRWLSTLYVDQISSELVAWIIVMPENILFVVAVETVCQISCCPSHYVAKNGLELLMILLLLPDKRGMCESLFNDRIHQFQTKSLRGQGGQVEGDFIFKLWHMSTHESCSKHG